MDEHTRPVDFCYQLVAKTSSAVEMQKGLTISHLHTQLDSFASKMTSCSIRRQRDNGTGGVLLCNRPFWCTAIRS